MINTLNVVIDCDPGIDDTLALIYAIKNPKFNVKAITIVSGNVPVPKGVKNAQYVLKMLNREDIPIYLGRTSSVYVDAEDTHGYNGLGNYDYGDIDMKSLSDMSACEYLSKITPADDITLIALGPLTNIWGAYCLNPRFFHILANMYIMGGAYRTHGNCTPVSEYNFWCDPISAKKVFEVMQHAVIVPLDVTRKIVLTPDKVEQIKDLHTSIGSFIEKITAYYMDFHAEHEGICGCVINDPLAVYIAECPYTGESEMQYAMVCDNMDITRGQMIVDSGNIYQHTNNCIIMSDLSKSGIDEFWTSFITIICD